jgi:Uma2 family endonuclease
MSTTVSPTPHTESSEAPVPARTYRFSRAQYERMVDAGVFAPDQQVELINGSIVPMSPQNSRHAAVTTRLLRLLMDACPEGYHVRSQVPLALGSASEPEPDVMIVPGSNEAYIDAHPTTASLVVEVADTSLAYDRDVKRTLYAAHSIATYWIVNLSSSCVEVYTDPKDDDYAAKRTRTRNDSISLPFADSDMVCSNILPK